MTITGMVRTISRSQLLSSDVVLSSSLFLQALLSGNQWLFSSWQFGVASMQASTVLNNVRPSDTPPHRLFSFGGAAT